MQQLERAAAGAAGVEPGPRGWHHRERWGASDSGGSGWGWGGGTTEAKEEDLARLCVFFLEPL